MCLIEDKKTFVKCNMLLKLKQICLLIICFIASIILGVSFAIVNLNNGACAFIFIAIVIFICVPILVFKVKESSGKAWERIFGQATSFRTTIELVNEDCISIKREGYDPVIIKKLVDIRSVEKFGATIVIMFSDNTSVILSKNGESNDFNNLIAIEQINNKRISSQKSFMKKIAIQLSICTLFLSFLVSYILSDALSLNTAAWVQYSYIMYFFAIIPLIVFVISIVIKSKKAASVAMTAMIFIALLGSFRFFFNSKIDYNTSLISNLEQRLNCSLPDVDRLITQDNLYYTSSIGKFNENKLLDDFENDIQLNDKWVNKLDLDTTNTTNRLIVNKTKGYDYFVLYNEKTKQYIRAQNNVDLNGCILFAYNSKTNSFLILYNF